MTTFLPDVNVLIALMDKGHDHHRVAKRWFEQVGHVSWLTCPTTLNGAIRVMSQSSYPRISLTPAEASNVLENLCRFGNRRSVPELTSVLEDANVDRSRLLTSKQVTDTHLLALAVIHDAMLVTLDRRLTPVAVRNGSEHLLKLL